MSSPPDVAAKGVLVPKSFHAILAHHHVSIDFAVERQDENAKKEHRHLTCAYLWHVWIVRAKKVAESSRGKFSLRHPPPIAHCCCQFLQTRLLSRWNLFQIYRMWAEIENLPNAGKPTLNKLGKGELAVGSSASMLLLLSSSTASKLPSSGCRDWNPWFVSKLARWSMKLYIERKLSQQ